MAGLFAVNWIVLPGFGAIDLAVTWSPNWPQVLEAGWGLFSTVLAGAAFVHVAVRPRALMQYRRDTAAGAPAGDPAEERKAGDGLHSPDE